MTEVAGERSRRASLSWGRPIGGAGVEAGPKRIGVAGSERVGSGETGRGFREEGPACGETFDGGGASRGCVVAAAAAVVGRACRCWRRRRRLGGSRRASLRRFERGSEGFATRTMR